ncbi:GtrA family protein [Pseudoduganella umbonata]|uniref:GtrA family protein n=1 Tax=Pseudoduganella umbonata TaxID=864828 RepID=A0A4P8HWN2_9BURK|nr:GtrA family protein [Pseudoduganella umbonata]MBB3223748.1 putative flippase GtrA [Pseudoduganella umbonata]QCP12825.1 GtrA family protein [Pseudoduganella umbonata]
MSAPFPASRDNFSARSLLAFLCVGGASTAAHYLVMLLLLLAGMPTVAASGIGFILSALLNYLLNERLTFHSHEQRRVTAPRFAIAAMTGLLLNHLLLTALMRAGLPTIPAQLLTTIGVIIWNYCIHGAWTFRSRRNRN